MGGVRCRIDISGIGIYICIDCRRISHSIALLSRTKNRERTQNSHICPYICIYALWSNRLGAYVVFDPRRCVAICRVCVYSVVYMRASCRWFTYGIALYRMYIVVSAYRHAVKNRDHHPTPKMPPLCAIRYNVYAHISGLLSYFTWHVYVKFNIHTRARAVNVYRWKYTHTQQHTISRSNEITRWCCVYSKNHPKINWRKCRVRLSQKRIFYV